MPDLYYLTEKINESRVPAWLIVLKVFIDEIGDIATMVCVTGRCLTDQRESCTERVLPHPFRATLEFLRVAAPPRGNSFFFDFSFVVLS